MKYPNLLTSIIMLSKDRLDYIKEALRALWGDTEGDANYEVIVIDNGSNQETLDYLQEVKDGRWHDKLRIIKLGQNFGITHALNIGLKEAKGQVWCKLDNDIIVEEHWLSRLLDSLHWGHEGTREWKTLWHSVGEVKFQLGGPNDPEAIWPKAALAAPLWNTNHYPRQGSEHHIPLFCWLWLEKGDMVAGGCYVVWKHLLDGFEFKPEPDDVQLAQYLEKLYPEYQLVVNQHVLVRHVGDQTTGGTKY